MSLLGAGQAVSGSQEVGVTKLCCFTSDLPGHRSLEIAQNGERNPSLHSDGHDSDVGRLINVNINVNDG